MSDEATVQRTYGGEPVRSIEVVVLEGPDAGARAETERGPLTVGSAEGNDLVLRDRTVSRYHLELAPRHDGIELTDLGSTNGTRVGPARFEGGKVLVPVGTRVEVGRSVLEVNASAPHLVATLAAPPIEGLVGQSAAVRRLAAQVHALAGKNVSVLLLGESGTGKEVLARALHAHGARPDGPFVTVDCGAIPATLLASELFGHEKGAFTGADRAHQGAFERASGGTLFLDELGELPVDQQASLLGALERRRIRRVGGREELAVDVRVVAATHRDLRRSVNEGTFRLDLYYRVAVVLLAVPPLRERLDDLPALVQHFLREEGHEAAMPRLFNGARLRELARHAWPGNVRELRNVVLATLALEELPALDGLAPAEAVEGSGPSAALLDLPYKDARHAWVEAFERPYLERLMERAEGSVRKAAQIAGVDRGYLSELLKRHRVGRYA